MIVYELNIMVSCYDAIVLLYTFSKRRIKANGFAESYFFLRIPHVCTFYELCPYGMLSIVSKENCEANHFASINQ